MNHSPISASPSPELRPQEGGLDAQLRGLRQILLATLVGGVILGVGVNLFLFRQVSLVTKDLAASRRLVEDYEKTKGPVLENLVTALQDFSRTHPDFLPILEKYGLKPGMGNAAAPGSGNPGTSGR